MYNTITIKNPAAVLNLAYLNGTPPKTRQDLEEALDQVLFCWSDALADDEAARVALGSRLAAIIQPHIEADDAH